MLSFHLFVMTGRAFVVAKEVFYCCNRDNIFTLWEWLIDERYFYEN